MPELYIDNEMGESEIIKPTYENEDAQTIWILALTEQYYDSMTLRLATSEEEEIYKQKAKSVIERLSLRGHLPRVKKDEPETYYEQLSKTDKQQKVKSYDEKLKIFNALKLKISRLVNKLALSIPAEPTDIMAENIEDVVVTPKIAIYFQGPYASINIQQGSKRRLYFIYPSPFPAWFHGQTGLDRSIIQENATSIEVPESIRNTLLEVLLDWLNIYLGYVV
ncbi:hypothetical protein K1T71_012920 [Dendrolimus kikuchii]|uniref:Uncharacterized protein n=1 Tax=Dendrolimus kikuchii TaxID=765133 RepID=A0ACC1CIL7_9NEOP|nr:hypothetical protein K1T71_012920 [Dendrolimus kikuchii]